MKNSILILSFLFISFASYSQWHVGGTLHDVNVVEWNKGSEANQLATISDWLVNLPK